MKKVAASEYDILTLTRGLVGQESLAALEGLLRRSRKLPDKMGPTSMGILQDTLAKGVVLQLARRGGWRTDRYLKAGEVAEGRAWMRHTPPVFAFSEFSIKLIRWLASQPVGNSDCPALSVKPKTLADELLMYFTLDVTMQLRCDTGVVRQPAFRGSPLCWLGFPDRLARDELEVNVTPELFEPLLGGDGPLVVECLQQHLASRWAWIEWNKQTIRWNAAMTELGNGQEAVASAWLQATDAANRRDLCKFLINAATDVLRGHAPADRWVQNLEARGPLRERTGARHAAGAFLRMVRTLHGWAEESGSIRFFEDEYEAAQLYLTQWERLGDEGFVHAERIIRELEAIDAVTRGREADAEGANQ